VTDELHEAVHKVFPIPPGIAPPVGKCHHCPATTASVDALHRWTASTILTAHGSTLGKHEPKAFDRT
jgi:hypothetical protein